MKYAFISVLLICLIAVPGAEKEFECFGIGGGGQMYGTGISPHDPGLMHVSCDMGTFYVTENNGQRWRMVNQLDMVGSKTSKPGYHPQDPNKVYMAYTRNGVCEFRVSEDKGNHWKVLCAEAPWAGAKGRDKFEQGQITIAFDPQNGDLVFVCTAKGIFRSEDGGKTFAAVNGFSGVALDVHVSVQQSLCLAGSSEGVFSSNDKGKTWSKIGKGIDDACWAFCAASDKRTGQEYCYVATKTSVFVSSDSGKSFSKTDLSLGKDEGQYRFMSMAHNNSKIAYVSNFGSKFGVWKTSDAGKTWENVFSSGHEGVRWGWLGTDYTKGFGGRANRITVDPMNADRIVYVNTGELFKSEDGGKTWQEGCSVYKGPDAQKIERNQAWAGIGLEVALPTDLVFDPFDKNRRYLIYGDIGFLISEDAGKSWRRSVKGIPRAWVNRMWEVFVDPDNKGVLYAACAGEHGTKHDTSKMKYPGGVVVSTDAGESWTVMSKGLPTDKKIPCTGLAVDWNSPKESRTLYCVYANTGVYKSTDGAKSWSLISQGIENKDNRNFEQVKVNSQGEVFALIIGKSKNWKFNFADGGLWKSSDGGSTWTHLSKTVKLKYPKEFAINPKNPSQIFIATTQAPGGERAGLWESKDGGTTWSRVIDIDTCGKDLYKYIHSGPVSFNAHKPEIVYYSTKTHGIWMSENSGKDWRRMRGVPRLATHRIISDAHDPQQIYVTSVGLWKGPATGY